MRTRETSAGAAALRVPFAALTLLLLLLLVVSPVLAYTYRAQIATTNSGSTSYTMLPVVVTPVANAWMSTNGFMESDALDTRVETLSGSDRPHMVADDKTLFASALPASGVTNLYFTTGNTPDLTYMPVITGYGGYVTVTDAAALEPTNNFVFETDGYVDTSVVGTGRALIYKKNAFVTYVSAVGTITSGIITAENTATVNLLPDGAGDYTNITSQAPAAGAHWDKVDDPVGIPDDAATIVYKGGAGELKDAYTLQAPAGVPDGAYINSVSVTMRVSNDDGNQPATPYLLLNGAEVAGTTRFPAAAWTDYTETIARPGGGLWTKDDLTSLQVVVGLTGQIGPLNAFLTQVYVTVTYIDTYTFSVSVSSVVGASGEYKVRTTADTVDLKLFIDDVEEDTIALGGASVANTANDWLLTRHRVMPYMDFYKETVAGVLTVWYQPVTIISGTVLSDRQGAAQNGIITWGANPSGVAVTLGSMAAAAQPTASSSLSEERRDILGDAGGNTNWFSDVDTAGLAATPFYPIVNALATPSGFGEAQIWIFFTLMLVLLFMSVAAIAVPGHVLVVGVACLVGIVFAVSYHAIFPWWTILFGVSVLLVTLVMERSSI